MIEVKDLLLKWNNLLLSEEEKNGFVRDAISQVLNITIENQDIKIKNNTVYLNLKPIYKNEILIKKDLINSKIKQFLKGRNFPTIR